MIDCWTQTSKHKWPDRSESAATFAWWRQFNRFFLTSSITKIWSLSVLPWVGVEKSLRAVVLSTVPWGLELEALRLEACILCHQSVHDVSSVNRLWSSWRPAASGRSYRFINKLMGMHAAYMPSPLFDLRWSEISRRIWAASSTLPLVSPNLVYKMDLGPRMPPCTANIGLACYTCFKEEQSDGITLQICTMCRMVRYCGSGMLKLFFFCILVAASHPTWKIIILQPAKR